MTHIQAIVISKDQYTLRDANAWIKRNNFHPIKKVHETMHTYRYRLRQPDESRYEYRMKAIKPGVKAVIGIPVEYLSNFYR